MSFFVEPNETVVNLVADRMAKDPVYADRYHAIKELREETRLHVPTVADVANANGMFRVASLQGPLLDLAEVLNPDFLKDKKKFYRFLDQHPENCTYDRRKFAKSGTRATFIDGKEA